MRVLSDANDAEGGRIDGCNPGTLSAKSRSRWSADPGISYANKSRQEICFDVTDSGYKSLRDSIALWYQQGTALDVLNRLQLKGFRLSIDDFGTGHSSLVQLRDIPFDELKIDRSFVHDAAIDPKLGAICGASLSLGQQLNMKVVAEGVENRADWDYLRRSACDLAQGYFIAKPMPAEDLLGWLVDWQKRLSGESLLG